jgi:hypothetical protein
MDDLDQKASNACRLRSATRRESADRVRPTATLVGSRNPGPRLSASPIITATDSSEASWIVEAITAGKVPPAGRVTSYDEAVLEYRAASAAIVGILVLNGDVAPVRVTNTIFSCGGPGAARQSHDTLWVLVHPTATGAGKHVLSYPG